MNGDIQRPSCPSGMLEPGAWPEVSEGRFYQVAQDCVTALQNLITQSATPWERQLRDIFQNGGGIWAGDASGAANSKGNAALKSFSEIKTQLASAANWNFDVSNAISSTKSEIVRNVGNAMSGFDELSSDDQTTRINECYQLNIGAISRHAASIDAATYRPSLTPENLETNGLPPRPPAGATAPTGGAATPPAGAPQPNLPPAGKTVSPESTTSGAPPPPPPTASPGGAPSPVDPPGGKAATPESKSANTPPPPGGSPGGPAVDAPDPIKAGAPEAPAASVPPQPAAPATPAANGTPSGGGLVTQPPPAAPRPANSTSAGGGATTPTSAGSSSPTSGLTGGSGGSGTQQSGNPTGQPTGAQTPGGQPNNPLQQGLQQLNQGLQSGAGNASQPLAAAQPATQQPTTPPPATPTGAASGTSATSAAPVGAASAAGGGSVGGPAAAAPTAPAAPLGPAPTPSPAAPVAQPGQGGPVGPAGPGVAAAGTNNQQAAAAAAPIPVSPARAERDAMAAAAKAGLLQRKSAGNTDADIEIARRISAALHAPPSIPAASYQFVWAVGVTSEGQILAANSYGIGYIPDGVKLPGQVTLVSADEAISPAERGRWVNFPFLAIQGWAQFHGKTLRAIIGTPEEVKPYKSSMHAEELAPDDIPADGTMQGRSRLQVIAPEAAARLEEWSDVTLYEALPPRPVQDAPPDAKQTMKLWVETIKPLLRTTGTNGPVDHLTKLIAYADHMQSVELYKAYTAPHVAAQRAAMSDWIYWQHVSSICQDATNPVLGSVQA